MKRAACAAAALKSGVAAFILLCSDQTNAVDVPPHYVGRDRCAGCHSEETARWSGSHHDLAMQEATEATVLGDFDDARFEQFGIVSRFYRKDGDFMVRTDGPDGKLHDYPIQYTFGVYPLQQYLIAFPGGRLQALDIAWDSRPIEDGGQRWMHLHPEDPVRHDDVLHWTGPNLNWNTMCADCHSTNPRKGYDADSDSYHTTWSEIDVSCEACHGPGSKHVQWAEAKARGEESDIPDLGLTVRLDERAGVTWPMNPDTGLARRSRPRTTTKELDVCARCHSRRSQMTDDTVAGQPFLDAFMPALLTEGLYYPDGQMQDEVYVWGSFLQSKMHQSGLTCSDCHDPHAADLRLPGEGVCYQCHASDRYATPAHHFHPEGSTGASCVECHMPATTFMVVDARHDHSFRIPRPAQSVALGTPNACNRCHQDQSAAWAAKQVETWYGKEPRGLERYAPALHAARAGLPGAGAQLKEIVADSSQPAIARATALAELGGSPDASAPKFTLALVQQGLSAADPLERLGALAALESFGPAQRAFALPLLWDDLKAVRIEAARLLAVFPDDRLPEQARAQRQQGIKEYIAAQAFNAERPEAQLNLGSLYMDRGDASQAEHAYLRAIDLQPQFIPAYVNLAHLLSRDGREPQASALLRRGLEQNSESADLRHALGLSLIRQKKPHEALVALAKAAELAPDNARYGYVHAVALQSSGNTRAAIAELNRVQQQHSGDTDILSALVSYHHQLGELDEALGHARKLFKLTPHDPYTKSLVKQLESAADASIPSSPAGRGSAD